MAWVGSAKDVVFPAAGSPAQHSERCRHVQPQEEGASQDTATCGGLGVGMRRSLRLDLQLSLQEPMSEHVNPHGDPPEAGGGSFTVFARWTEHAAA